MTQQSNKNYYQVTDEQLSKTHRVFDEQDFSIFYQVESQTTPGDEYKVWYDRGHRLITCNCKAGQSGMNCWHKRAAVAHAAEHRKLMQEVQQYNESGRDAWLKEIEEFEESRLDFENEQNYLRMERERQARRQAPINNRNQGFQLMR